MNRPIAKAVILIAISALSISATAKTNHKKAAHKDPPDYHYAQRSEAMQFADDLAERRGLDREWARQAIGQARLLREVPRLVLPPPKGQPKNWAAYRARFIEPVRIRAGLRFWQDNTEALARAEKEYGVPAEIIVGIIGVETIYGQHMGGYRVIDALATLSFDFPDAHPRAAERRAFFQRELEQFLSLMDRTGTDPHEPRGSYAGAMGLGQFMPSSWARWAVDFDGDGRIDLWRSPADAIGSVANYFVAHGWRTGMATHYPVQFDAAQLRLDELLAPDILPTFSAASMASKGVQLLDGGSEHQGSLALVELQNGGAPPSYVAGTENFYAVTRYNWSSYYAMAVIELGRAVAAARL
ncbi:MAG TPA: lytic murein transglycosylase B [Alicycliphilus sp.]|nr:lytic murein transglycosylase B [Alicycliphilus sp.]